MEKERDGTREKVRGGGGGGGGGGGRYWLKLLNLSWLFISINSYIITYR